MSDGYENAFPPALDERDLPACLNGTGFGQGLTKRELFAAMAMQGLLANRMANTPPDVYAGQSVVYADALLAELAKQS